MELKGKALLFRRRKLLRLFNIIWQSKGDGFVSVAFQLAVLAIGLGARLKCSLLFRIQSLPISPNFFTLTCQQRPNYITKINPQFLTKMQIGTRKDTQTVETQKMFHKLSKNALFLW